MPALALKYVILREHTTELRVALFCLAPMKHIDLSATLAHRAAPVSAGFCSLLADGTVRTFGRSDSLCLTPSPEDAAFLTAFMRATARAGA